MNIHNPEQIDSGVGLNQLYKLCTNRVHLVGKPVTWWEYSNEMGELPYTNESFQFSTCMNMIKISPYTVQEKYYTAFKLYSFGMHRCHQEWRIRKRWRLSVGVITSAESVQRFLKCNNLWWHLAHIKLQVGVIIHVCVPCYFHLSLIIHLFSFFWLRASKPSECKYRSSHRSTHRNRVKSKSDVSKTIK